MQGFLLVRRKCAAAPCCSCAGGLVLRTSRSSALGVCLVPVWVVPMDVCKHLVGPARGVL
jgi:hypothetical protein